MRRGAIFLGAFLLPFGLLAIGFARLPWRGRWLTWLWGGLVATALAFAAVGGVPVGHPGRLLEPERRGVQRVRAVLPRQLRLLGPVGLRALPHRRDPRLARGHPPRRRPRLAGRGALRRRLRDVARAPHLVLPVELRRARGGNRRRGRRRVGAAGDAGARRARRGDARGDRRRAADPRRARRAVALRVQPDHVGSREPRRPGLPHRARQPGAGRRRGRLLARVRATARHPGPGSQARRVAHDPGHRRRRGGPGRARAPRVARRRRLPRDAARPRTRLHLSRLPRDRDRPRRDRGAQRLLRGVLRGSDDVGAARASSASSRASRRSRRRPSRALSPEAAAPVPEPAPAP